MPKALLWSKNTSWTVGYFLVTSLVTALETIENFGEISGLRLNSKNVLKSNLNGYKIKSKLWECGFQLIRKLPTQLIMMKKLKKTKNTLNTWELRRLPLLGKITVLKSLAASQLVYILSPLKKKRKICNRNKSTFLHLLWNGKGCKIKQNVIIADYTDEGLRMLDIASFN